MCFIYGVALSHAIAFAPLAAADPPPRLNEVFFRPIPKSREVAQRSSFVEIFRLDTAFDLTRCSLSNADGSHPPLVFPPEVADVDHQYFTVRENPKLRKLFSRSKKVGNGGENTKLRTSFSLSKKDGILSVKELGLRDIDSLALICDGRVEDYVAWGVNGTGPNGTLHDAAVSAGHWPNGTDAFVETAPLGGGENVWELRRGVLSGDSLGRDADSADTDRVEDWLSLGGLNATGPTPGKRNIDEVAAQIDFYAHPTLASDGPDQDMGKQDSPEQDSHEQAPHHRSLKKQNRKKPKPPSVAEWTIMSYVDPSDPKIHNYIRKAIMALALVGSTKKVQFVLQAGAFRIYFHPGGIFASFQSYQIIDDPWRTDEKTALSNFISWAKTNFPAKKYALHILAHGNGWKGICVWQIKVAPKTIYTLTMAELRDALAALGRKFSVVYFESCLMAGLEVAYQLVDRAEFVTFSEEILWKITNFVKWAQMFRNNWRHPPKEMAILLAKEYAAAAKRSTYRQKYTISVVDLSKIKGPDLLSGAVDAFAGKLVEDMATIQEHDDKTDNLNIIYAKYVLSNADKFHDKSFVDLADLANYVRLLGDEFKAGAKARDVIDKVDDAVVWLENGDVVHPLACGLHIYHPRSLLKGPKSDKPYDYPLPSATIYSLDPNAVILQKFDEKHSQKIDSGFLYPLEREWDAFLIRFYKPTADACARIDPKKCVNQASVGVGQTVMISGAGSSDGDPNSEHIRRWWWDTNLTEDTAGNKPEYKYGTMYDKCTKDGEDCDRDDIDESDDDPDQKGETWDFKCEKEGNFTFRLMVLDSHHIKNKTWRENIDHNKGTHWLHFQEDSAFVTVICTSNATATPSEDPSFCPSSSPTDSPANRPSATPSAAPSASPTNNPSTSPSTDPSADPSRSPTNSLTDSLANRPSTTPTATPSASPTNSPATDPFADPSRRPTSSPTDSPTTNRPSATSSGPPSAGPH